MKSIACILCVLIAQLAWAEQRPNVVFILIDDMGWNGFGAAGNTFHETPHLDALAASGKMFTRAYSASPVCSPSRGAIYSGKNPARTQLTTVWRGADGPDDRLHKASKYDGRDDQNLEARMRHVLPKTEVTFAQALKNEGYATGHFGKWHIGAVEGYYPEHRGFDVSFAHVKDRSKKKGHWGSDWDPGNCAHHPDFQPDEFLADTITDRCVDFISANKDKPFLAVLSHYIVHGPIKPRPEKIDKYADKSNPNSPHSSPKYAALMESVDDSVGRVVEALEAHGLGENTLIIFTSDNGGHSTVTSNYPLTGGKSFPFEGGQRVPFIASWPTKVEPGLFDEPVVGMDIYPTILSATGTALMPEQHVDGIDLMAALVEGASLPERSLITHFPHYTHATGPFTSIQADGWKLIRFYNDSEGRYLLYNLNEDPYELNDLASSHPEKLQSLDQMIDTFLVSAKAEMPQQNPKWPNVKMKKGGTLETTLTRAAKGRKSIESRLEK